MKSLIKVIILILFCAATAQAQTIGEQLKSTDRTKAFKLTYKQIDGVSLDLTFHYPPKFKKNKTYPTIIFYFGGGWNGGTTEQFKPQAEYFASRGMITVLADYRVKSRHKTTPYEAAADAKSAIRFLRQNAKELNIDTEGIVASGGSAGGHLAAVTGVCAGLDEADEDLTISSKPNALVLFNPVFDNGPDGFEHKRMGECWKEISPAHNIEKNAPPTIVFLGKKDHLIPVSIAENYREKMDEAGCRCDLFLYDDAGHGFFNLSKYEGKFYYQTVREADRFLESLGYITGKPKI